MALIKMTYKQGEKYRGFLNSFRVRYGKEPGAAERTEAFICARGIDPWKRPTWCK
jgi:hypothetical protein